MNKPKSQTDFLVVGGGVMGITIALELARRFADCKITLIEKESDFGVHASGRNSGVLHAGFYYTADSLKARFTREGNRRWREYCRQHGLMMEQPGKVVVARNEQERTGIRTLMERGQANGVEVEQIDEKQLYELEPSAKTVGDALFSPTTASVVPSEIMQQLIRDARAAGVELQPGTVYIGRERNGVRTSNGVIEAGYVVNTAGLQADYIARDYGYAEKIRIFPFKGLYLYDASGSPRVKRHVYPVPDLRNPFLGVHFTVTAMGQSKIGPTAIPAFWRENYSGFKDPKWDEFRQILGVGASLFLNNRFGFRALTFKELLKNSRAYLAHQAGKLVDGLDMRRFRSWGKPGIRAQPVNLETRRLEMDFLYEGDSQSFHLLNAVSPAFTCSLPFSEYLVDQIVRKLDGSPENLERSE